MKLVFAVVPLLLLFCQCGGADTIFPDQFTDLPIGTKQHLISYHTEGKGKDEVCVCVRCLFYTVNHVKIINLRTTKMHLWRCKSQTMTIKNNSSHFGFYTD